MGTEKPRPRGRRGESVAAFLRRRGPAILGTWERRASATRHPWPGALRQHVATVLDRVADRMEGQPDATSPGPPAAVEEPEVAVALLEVHDLRHSILELWHQEVRPSLAADETLRLDDALDDTLAAAARRAVRERRDRALRYVVAAGDPEDLTAFLHLLVKLIPDNLPSLDLAALDTVDGERLVVLAAVGAAWEGLEGRSHGRDAGLAGQVARSREPLVIKAPQLDARAAGDPFLPPEVRMVLAIPVVSQGECVGVVLAGSTTQATVEDDDAAFVHAVARCVATFLELEGRRERDRTQATAAIAAQAESARQLVQERFAKEGAERVARDLGRLDDVATRLGRVQPSDVTVRLLASECASAVRAPTGWVVLVGEDGTSIDAAVATGGADAEAAAPRRLQPDLQDVVRAALRSDEPVIATSVAAVLEAHPRLRGAHDLERFDSLLTVPLVGEDRTWGAMVFGFRAPHPDDAWERAFLSLLARHGVLALERARLYEIERTARDEAQRALAQLKAFVAAAPVGVGFLDRDLRFVMLNAPLARINGVPVAAHLGRAVEDILPPSVAHQATTLLARVRDSGEPLIDAEMKTPAPDDRTLLVNYFAVRDERDHVVGVGGVVVDITGRKRTEEALAQAALFRELFLGVVGHDLKNPLNTILLAASALARDPGLTAAQHRRVRRQVMAAERMSRMIDDLLDVTQSRLGAGISIAPALVDLGDVVRQAVEDVEAMFPGRTITCSLDGDLRGAWDPDRLIQVVSNLLNNAIAYGDERAPVIVRLARTGDDVVLRVENQGPPIPEDVRARLFDPFRRGREAHHHRPRGLGLGLFIVHQIVLAHGGVLDVTSTGEAGTVFTITLPVHGTPPARRRAP